MLSKYRWLFFFLLFTVLIMLFLQWKQLNGPALLREEARQQFEIKHVKGKLIVNQTVENMDKGKYTILLPNSGEKFVINDQFVGNEKIYDIEVTGNMLEIQYEIRVPDDVRSFVLEDWYAVIDKFRPGETSLHIIELDATGGSWASNAVLSYESDQDHLNYYVFNTDTDDLFLYWQKEPLQYAYIKNKIPVFYEKGFKTEIVEDLVKILNKSNYHHVPAMIITESTEPVKHPLVVIFPPKTEKGKLMGSWVGQFITANAWNGQDEEKWVIPLLASFVTEQPPENPKLNEMYQEVGRHLTDDEMEKFRSSILNLDRRITSLSDIDRILGGTKGLQTTFFQDHQDSGTEVKELQFFTEQEIFVDGNGVGKKKIYFYKNSNYFPFQVLMESFGYRYKTISANEIIVSGSSAVYRFYDNKDFVYLNEEQFGILSLKDQPPFIKIHDQFYIQEQFLVEIFSLKVYNQNEKVIFFR